MSNCKCSKCGHKEDFDAQVAYERLYEKYVELADVMVEYMSEAKLKRSLRATNALGMATKLATSVGGRATGDFPEFATIGNCSGVLVHPRIVLTAAHCTGISWVGINCQTRNNPVETIEVYRSRPHDLYRPSTSNFYDFRVLILKRAADTPFVEIATPDEFRNARETTVVGFSNSGRKRHLTVQIDPSPNFSGVDLSREFVAGGDGVDTCNGDSGGPAYIDVGGIKKVAGLTSRGLTNRCGDGGIYTRVDVHRDFIRRIAGESEISFP